jgi:hypothetical protein
LVLIVFGNGRKNGEWRSECAKNGKINGHFPLNGRIR